MYKKYLLTIYNLKIFSTDPSIFIKNKEWLSEKIKWFKEINNLHILADFDRTMSHSLINWEKRSGIIQALRNDESILWEEYSKKAHGLFDKYHKYEIDNNISKEKKCDYMLEWRENHMKLLVESNLNISDIKKCINWNIIKLRSWIIKLLNYTNINNIPFIIMSANWLGWDSIKLYLEENNLNNHNIDIISNNFKFDENWYVKWYSSKIIHVFNKSEVAINMYTKVHDKIENKKDVILLWDSLWDVWMIDWFDYNNLIKIWFYNESFNNNIEDYLDSYDIVLTWDNSWEYINEFINNLYSN